jgi:hypothetical protein
MSLLIETMLKTRASAAQCANCPPARVCAWSCVQGANMEEVAAGAYLMAEGRLNPVAPRPSPEVQAVADELFENYDWVGD